MALKLNSSGGGSVTIDPVSTASNVTITVPATSGGSVVVADSSGNVTATGGVSGTTGTFSGAVSGTTGAFNGDVQMVSQNAGQLAGLRNKIINGDFRVSQRGTSFASGAAQYGADRWQFYRLGSGAGATFARTNAVSAIALGYNNYAQFNHNNTDTSLTAICVSQSIETINIRELAGKTVTLSFYCFCSGDAVGRTVGSISYGTGTDGSLGVGFTGQTLAGSITSPSNNSWVRSSVTVTLPSTATQLGVQFAFTPSVTGAASDYFGLVGVQLELGSVVTPFEQIPYGLSLQLCQRYYETSANMITAWAQSTTAGKSSGIFQVPKRIAPSVALYTAATWNAQGPTGTFASGLNSTMGTITITGYNFPSSSLIGYGFDYTNATALTQGTGFIYIFNSQTLGAPALAFNAEM